MLESEPESLIKRAAEELKAIKNSGLVPFPPTCYKLVRNIHGNNHCIDCGSCHPTWASISFGALICIKCSGMHRSLGIHISKVRNLELDHWSHDQIICMLEGGNSQLHEFFDRHFLVDNGIGKREILEKRYRTKAASFYRHGIRDHIEYVIGMGEYRGRKFSRLSPRGQAMKPLRHSINVCSEER